MSDRLRGRQDDYRRALADPVRFDVAFYAGLYAEALEAEVERLQGELSDATEVLGYRDRDIEKFRKGTLAFTAEVERLQARVRELEAAVREYLQAEGSSGDLGIRDDRYVVRQRLLTAVSAEKEES